MSKRPFLTTFLVLGALCLLTHCMSSAQQDEKKGVGVNLPDAAKEAAEKDAADKAAGKLPKENAIAMPTYIATLIMCSLGILATCIGSLWVVVHLLKENKLPIERGPQLIGLILIVSFGTFIVVAGYGQTQIAPLMTILGASLGYLFGKDWGDKPASTDKPPSVNQT